MPTMESTALFTRMSTVSAMRATVSAAVSLLRSTTTMIAPSRAIANEIPRPTPCPAPVTTATLPSRMPTLRIEVIYLDVLGRQSTDDQRGVGPHTAVVAPFHEQW